MGGRGGRRGRGGESADTSSSQVGYGQPGVGYGATMVSAGPHPGAQVAQQEGAKGEVRHAVVITGRVPYAKQFEEYQKRFKEAATFEGHSPEMDVPKYLLFKVERQEVTATGGTEWKALDLDAREKLEVNWIAASEEMVDPVYIYGNDLAQNILAWPMPPAIQRDWRRLQTHPSVPLALIHMEEEQLGSTKREWDESQTRRVKSLPPTGGYEEGGRGARMPFAVGSGPEGYAEVMTPHVPHLLFRFVDLDKLEANKQYRYRVSLELENPNYSVPPQLLENAASTNQATIWTPTAESPVVTVESDRQLFALSTKGSGSDREANFMFHAFDKKIGAEIAKEFDLKLGGIADFVATVENWYNIYTSAGEKIENYQFRFEEGAPMLADVDGGGTLPGGGNIKQPAEMLFVDAQGRLFTSNQATDAATAEFYKERYTLVPEATETSGPNILEDAGPAAPIGGRR
jgi:hypothetical protein